jgi:beta-fructofuranosidase
MLRLDDKWIWDFWLVHDGSHHHVFYLQAPRSLGDPDLRHRHATVGHAVSEDLVSWTVLPDAFGPGAPGAWDDGASWTGSVIAHGGQWWLFYTGVRQAEERLVQRIGAATSRDLVSWTRHPGNPLIETDPLRYETLDLTKWHDQAWRDPWVMKVNGSFEAFITARASEGPADARGVVARARSVDLVDWRIGDPIEITPAGQFGHLEVPEVIQLESRWYLIFCTSQDTHSAAWRSRTGRPPLTGTYYAVGDGPTGPFTLVDSAPLGPDDGSVCYSGRITHTNDGPRYLAWRMFDADGTFAGEIIDPLSVSPQPDGHLVLNALRRA